MNTETARSPYHSRDLLILGALFLSGFFGRSRCQPDTSVRGEDFGMSHAKPCCAFPNPPGGGKSVGVHSGRPFEARSRSEIYIKRKRAFHAHAFISWPVRLPTLGRIFQPAIYALKACFSTRPYVAYVATFINHDYQFGDSFGLLGWLREFVLRRPRQRLVQLVTRNRIARSNSRTDALQSW